MPAKAPRSMVGSMRMGRRPKPRLAMASRMSTMPRAMQERKAEGMGMPRARPSWAVYEPRAP